MTFVAIQPAQAADATFAIGDKTFTMPIPAGFCLPAGKDAAVAQLIASADSQNVTVLTLVKCSHVPGTGMEDYFLLKSPVRALMMDMPREELLAALQPELAAQDNLMSDANKAKVDENLSNAFGTAASVGGAYRYVGRTGACLDMAGTMTFSANGKSVETDAASCLTGVGGKMLAIHHYSKHGAATFAGLLATVRTMAATVRAAD
ncbi:hypothetical protein ACOYW6_04690 [Parablastomonas sp. CN1-191]|uniref:hypothetical protein n=1 Tax=Parablastomonas sp. CN1-191 TaxID=3400908 RepID=UPI003BF8325E